MPSPLGGGGLDTPHDRRILRGTVAETMTPGESPLRALAPSIDTNTLEETKKLILKSASGIQSIISRAHRSKLDPVTKKRMYYPLAIGSADRVFNTLSLRLSRITKDRIYYSVPEDTGGNHGITDKASRSLLEYSSAIAGTFALSTEYYYMIDDREQLQTSQIIVEGVPILNIHTHGSIASTMRKTIQKIVDTLSSVFIGLKNKELINTDPGTNVPNRGSLKVLEDKFNAAHLEGETVFVLMLDLDHFKTVNDTYGHHAGDAVLHTVAQQWKEICDMHEVHLARYGGEEFVVMGIGNQERAMQIAHLLKDTTEGLLITTTNGTVIPPITVSIGATTVASENLDIFATIAIADTAVYNAKSQRNSIVFTTTAIQNRKSSPPVENIAFREKRTGRR